MNIPLFENILPAGGDAVVPLDQPQQAGLQAAQLLRVCQPELVVRLPGQLVQHGGWLGGQSPGSLDLVTLELGRELLQLLGPGGLVQGQVCRLAADGVPGLLPLSHPAGHVVVEAELGARGRERDRGGDVGGGLVAGEAVVQVDGVSAGRHAGVGGGAAVLWLGSLRPAVEVSLQDLALAPAPADPPGLGLHTSPLRHPRVRS